MRTIINATTMDYSAASTVSSILAGDKENRKGVTVVVWSRPSGEFAIQLVLEQRPADHCLRSASGLTIDGLTVTYKA